MEKDWYCHTDRRAMTKTEARIHVELGHEVENHQAFFGTSRTELFDIPKTDRAGVFDHIFGDDPLKKDYF